MNRSLVSMVMAPRHVSSSSACLVQNQLLLQLGCFSATNAELSGT